MTNELMQIRNRNMWQLWLLVLLFALPAVAAWMFYYNPQWLPQARSNHGALITPPRAMDPLMLQSPQGEGFDWGRFDEMWTMTVVAEGGCDEPCIEKLIKIRQIRRAMAANRQRVERLLILLPDASGNLEPPSLDGLEGTRVAIAESADKQEILELFAAGPATIDNAIFLIDPMVDLMMVHDMSQITSKQILQDLETLLKASQSWVKGGQYGHK
ncbi:MAG: hypothetical protein ABFR19_03470 [Pseudomonadota bacterium]